MAVFQEGLSEALIRAWRRREEQVRLQELEAFRLVHGVADGLPGIEIDAYGEAWLVTLESEEWIRRLPALEKDLAEVQDRILLGRKGSRHFVANLPNRRQALPAGEPAIRSVVEDGLRFEIRLGQGPHAGLFLDQRENRRETRRLARGRRCLNLFCYSGSFSMAALEGGAEAVESVDLSKKALAWLDRNRELNGFAAERSRTRAEDVWLYLEKAGKKRERFELILLDPPSFGRSPKRNFNLARDFESLVAKAAALLDPKGDLLVSLNLEAMTRAEFRRRLKAALQALGRKKMREIPLPFDFPVVTGREPHLKSAWSQGIPQP